MGLARRATRVFLSFLLFLSLFGLGFAFTMNRTALNPDFLISELDRLDVPSLAEEALREQIPEEISSMLPPEFIDEVLDDVTTDLEPWLREQASVVIYTGYDYLLGRTENLSLIVDMGPAKEIMRDSVWQAFLASLPLGLEMLPPAGLEGLFNEFYQQLSEQIPSTIEVNESVINELSPDLMPVLAQARRYIGYLQIAYWVLIASTALLIMGIILLDRRVRGATRWLGIPCLIAGVLSYVGTFVARHFAGILMTQIDLPVQLQAWLPQLLNDSLAPMQVYGIVLMAVGVALLVISFIYRRHQAEFYQG